MNQCCFDFSYFKDCYIYYKDSKRSLFYIFNITHNKKFCMKVKNHHNWELYHCYHCDKLLSSNIIDLKMKYPTYILFMLKSTNLNIDIIFYILHFYHKAN